MDWRLLVGGVSGVDLVHVDTGEKQLELLFYRDCDRSVGFCAGRAYVDERLAHAECGKKQSIAGVKK